MILVANKSYQLGNRLFLFAHLIAFAAEHNITVANPSMDNYCEHFEHLRRDLFCRFPLRRPLLSPTAARRRLYHMTALWSRRFHGHPSFIPRGVTIIDIDLHEVCYLSTPQFLSIVRSNHLVALRGWRYRDSATFDKHAEVIRKFFEPVHSVKENVASLLHICRKEAGIVVGVHIRGGDYRDFREGRYFYEVTQYVVLMRQMVALCPNQTLFFLICSNETLSADDFAEFKFGFGSSHIAEDLYSLAECDYLIGPPSTYSQWASFYGRVPQYKIVDPDRVLSLDDFEIADGNCDLPEDIASCQKWNPENGTLHEH